MRGPARAPRKADRRQEESKEASWLSETTRVPPREEKNITSGVAHVNAAFNNTMITITDAQGNAIAWSSARADGLQGIA